MDCYEEIVQFYINEERSTNDTKTWCDNFIIKLMRGNYSNLQIKNCLLLIINLFNEIRPDMYYKEGRVVEELSDGEKRIVREILRIELLDKVDYFNTKF